MKEFLKEYIYSTTLFGFRLSLFTVMVFTMMLVNDIIDGNVIFFIFDSLILVLEVLALEYNYKHKGDRG